MNYQELPVSKELLQAVKNMGFTEMTEIQQKAIPLLLDGAEVMAKAPTGTGKTCAFGIPMIEHIDLDKKGIQGLILCPTRELALQIKEELTSLCALKESIRICCVYGGQPIRIQINELHKNPQIVVATPGRLIDHMKHNTIRLADVSEIILDEADEMVSMGFYKDVEWILKKLPKTCKLSMFSATTSREVMDISWLYQKDPQEIVVLPVAENKPKITQYSINSVGSKKIDELMAILSYYQYHKAIVFCNTKYQTASLCRILCEQGFKADCIHGDMIQSARNKMMQQFRENQIEILVVTDVAARGIDVENVEVVFNFDLPQDNEYYVHRIGRTGRAKSEGIAYTFYSDEERFRLRDIIKYTKSKIQSAVVLESGEVMLIQE